MKLWDPFITEKIPFRKSDQEYLLTAIMLEQSSIINKLVASYIHIRRKRIPIWIIVLIYRLHGLSFNAHGPYPVKWASLDFERICKEVEQTTNILEADCMIID